MNILTIIDQFIDDREFRNIVASLLKEKGFNSIDIDDIGLRDSTKLNDNDILAEKDGMHFTVQTFLNVEITRESIDEVHSDMHKEGVSYGILVTNMEVSSEIFEYADKIGITIWDRKEFMQSRS